MHNCRVGVGKVPEPIGRETWPEAKRLFGLLFIKFPLPSKLYNHAFLIPLDVSCSPPFCSLYPPCPLRRPRC